jgi:prolyl-tRNA synthetase
MRYSLVFPKTKKVTPKKALSKNHALLVKAGFMDQLMTGSWTLTHLGWRVIGKIHDTIRGELKKIDAQEVLMPLLHPKNIWNETGRWDKAKDIMYQFKDSRGKEYALSFTHEEIFLDLVRKNLTSYQDLPIALYQFSTKFRNELRAKSGILRGREFLMKDLYSVHATEKDFWSYYEKVKNAYSNIFSGLGFDFRITEAAGGVFTDNNTHEFQVLADGGEDTIFYCDKCLWGVNKEIYSGDLSKNCPSCKKGQIKTSKSIEVGNIFPFGTHYSEMMHVYYTDKKGFRKPVWFGSYGIGTTRLMGTWVEVSSDDRGIIWNKAMSPFDAHLIDLTESDEKGSTKAQELYQKLGNLGVEVLWDERTLSAGEKFADADLIGIPYRIVVSKKTKDKYEVKERRADQVKFLTFENLVKYIQSR